MQGRQPPMHLHQDIHSRPHGVADGLHVLDGQRLVPAVDVRSPWAGEGIELERREALLHGRQGLLGHTIRIATAGPPVRVDAQSRPEGAPEQVVDRLTGCFAHEVPQGLLEAADGAVQIHRPALGGEIGIGHVREVLDVERAAVDQVAPELLDVGLDGSIAVQLRVALAPAVQAIVGFELDEEPALVGAGIDEKRPDGFDFHGLSAPSSSR